MDHRILFWFFALVLLTSAGDIAHGEVVGQPGAAIDNLFVTIDLPRTSAQQQILPPSVIVGTAADDLVRLRVPVKSEQLAGLPLAEVDKEPVTLGEFRRAIAPAGHERGEEPSPGIKGNPMEFLGRLVNMRLIVREAREIGLDELPEIRNNVDSFSRKTLRETLILRYAKGVEADEADVARLYREAIREWRIKALLFKEEKDADAFQGDVQAGMTFEGAAKKYVSEGKAVARGGQDGEFVKAKDISPEMGEKIAALEVGSVSPVFRTGAGFTVIKVEEMRLSESTEALVQARQRARNFSQNTALEGYLPQLISKYVTVDNALFTKLDFGGSEDNFLRMLKDDREIARVEGEEPVTVSQLAQGIREQFYHGLEKAIEQGTVNERKLSALSQILAKRAFLKEARAQGIDKTTEFLDAVADYENAVLFGAFVEKVLKPEIKIAPSDLRKYYEGHIDQYSYPEMVKYDSIVFGSASAAQAALDKLRKGTDSRWMKANAEGQVRPVSNDEGGTGEGLVVVRSLPEAIRNALDGAKEGDFVFYRQGESSFMVLNVEKRVPSRAQPFEEVQERVLQQVYKEKLESALGDWMKRLKDVYGAKVYATGFSESAP